jgi:sugar/nucleoside kinase (ribokinase family)
VAVTVVGSIAFDSVTTPFGSGTHELGGCATYAALAAARFTDVRIVGPVGDDFLPEHRELLARSGVDTSGIDHVRGQRTFSWRGHYELDLSAAHTDGIELNVFAGWRPLLPRASRDASVVFLAAMDPETQLGARAQSPGSRWVALDTAGYWIEHKRDALVEAIRAVDLVLMNDQEARALTRSPMLLKAAREIASWGPRAVVLKLGEYGYAALQDGHFFSLPGYPLEQAADPTGAGDAFAGGFLGYLDLAAPASITPEVLRRAVTYGAVMASYCVEDFGTRRIAGLTQHELEYRAADFKQMTHFVHVPTEQRPWGEPDDAVPRFERPAPTPSTVGLQAPGRTAGTQTREAPHRTPSTESLPRPGRPLPPRTPYGPAPGSEDDNGRGSSG